MSALTDLQGTQREQAARCRQAQARYTHAVCAATALMATAASSRRSRQSTGRARRAWWRLPGGAAMPLYGRCTAQDSEGGGMTEARATRRRPDDDYTEHKRDSRGLVERNSYRESHACGCCASTWRRLDLLAKTALAAAPSFRRRAAGTATLALRCRKRRAAVALPGSCARVQSVKAARGAASAARSASALALGRSDIQAH